MHVLEYGCSPAFVKARWQPRIIKTVRLQPIECDLMVNLVGVFSKVEFRSKLVFKSNLLTRFLVRPITSSERQYQSVILVWHQLVKVSLIVKVLNEVLVARMVDLAIKLVKSVPLGRVPS